MRFPEGEGDIARENKISPLEYKGKVAISRWLSRARAPRRLFGENRGGGGGDSSRGSLSLSLSPRDHSEKIDSEETI